MKYMVQRKTAANPLTVKDVEEINIEDDTFVVFTNNDDAPLLIVAKDDIYHIALVEEPTK